MGQLWEFLLELLNDSQSNPGLIRWVCRKKGIFKLTQNERVAQMWGQMRQNPKMNYKKMSRTMRYSTHDMLKIQARSFCRHYYKKKIMVPVIGKKLVYQFGPNVVRY